jgi:hypothetical protein
VVTVAFALSGVDVGGGADVVGDFDVPPVGPPAEVDGGAAGLGADVDGAVTLGGGAATAALRTGGPGSNRQTAMNPAIDRATTKIVLFTADPSLGLRPKPRGGKPPSPGLALGREAEAFGVDLGFGHAQLPEAAQHG